MKFQGVLFFPVTPFGSDGSLDEERLAQHIEAGVAAGAGGVFVACGTGEFHALTPDEIERATRVAVSTVGGRVPVLAAAGGPPPVARDHAARVERAGADGILLLPPYLVSAPQRGLVRYVKEVTEATGLPVVFYQRGTARLTAATAAEIAALPGVVGLKDGIGDLERMHRIVRAVRAVPGTEGFQFFNGLPTAEMTAPAYQGIGVSLYSSAVFAFAPEIALAFHRALGAGDEALVDTLLDEFYGPLVELRDEVPGYAVSLIKAGVTLRGLDVGGVRAPLLDPAPEHIARLAKLIDHGLGVVGA
ncbi:5-dehydro-4-deoxyglucarate dehydratase [Streptomyces ipomoeae]|uniref:Probable 5-dehydro-4-deoxyglucarate dehydratase n=2 Tax=Streptomyces ipomoeae TaxID=103232 RepID=L1KS55_9ACTN|nr:5-dehydro-4-deoxyglucarate dehydratase [Streptomyces ipomoeae]EKX63213.1 dihydrodipicolinate synthetase family protein [Streptomyces ipomoeae 91-03]MDX2693600.1 5-dehydro-4-deoxyglucarate dehydratase [Streptomyces ipomoeae]MDX2821078.1 5-dehydro-4-deoxyglucarate dehydratase [Streptomyces ipomoeae]MDX2839237.1 5-dehydro-4-deoxyglucarate dehydratase [Streptomyces ipomoeae]MDX2872164.1 5-dehydro-4-deoxyglucarate dehydratase [Streptomyces ipomoeae]